MDDGDVMSDAGSPAPVGTLCSEGVFAQSDEYWPMAVGNLWRYQVTEGTADPITAKRNELREEVMPDGETRPVVVQWTEKATGTTESWLRRDGDVVVRLRQMDYTTDGLLERTTVYDPPRIRIDESPEHTADGASWIEEFVRIVYDPVGNELYRETVRDSWTVLGSDVPCETAFGNFTCLHLHRLRVEGGLSIKEYKFVRGLGKVAELGAKDEVLTECELH